MQRVDQQVMFLRIPGNWNTAGWNFENGGKFFPGPVRPEFLNGIRVRPFFPIGRKIIYVQRGDFSDNLYFNQKPGGSGHYWSFDAQEFQKIQSRATASVDHGRTKTVPTAPCHSIS